MYDSFCLVFVESGKEKAGEVEELHGGMESYAKGIKANVFVLANKVAVGPDCDCHRLRAQVFSSSYGLFLTAAMGGKRKKVAVLRAIKPSPKKRQEKPSENAPTKNSNKKKEFVKRGKEVPVKTEDVALPELNKQENTQAVSTPQPKVLVQGKNKKRKKEGPKDSEKKAAVGVSENKKKSEPNIEEDSVLISKFHVLQKRLCQVNGVRKKCFCHKGQLC